MLISVFSISGTVGMTNHTLQTKIWKKQVFAPVVVRVLKVDPQQGDSIPPI
jgi:hypothetical protein